MTKFNVFFMILLIILTINIDDNAKNNLFQIINHFFKKKIEFFLILIKLI